MSYVKLLHVKYVNFCLVYIFSVAYIICTSFTSSIIYEHKCTHIWNSRHRATWKKITPFIIYFYCVRDNRIPLRSPFFVDRLDRDSVTESIFKIKKLEWSYFKFQFTSKLYHQLIVYLVFCNVTKLNGPCMIVCCVSKANVFMYQSWTIIII